MWVEGVARFEQTVDGLVELARRTGREQRSGHPPQDRADLRAGVEPAVPRLQGLRVVRPGLVGTRALVHEDGDVRSRARPRTSSEWRSAGPYGAVTDAERGEESGRWVHGFFVDVRQHDRGRQRPRSSATSSPSGCWASRGPETRTDGLHPHRRPTAPARNRTQAARQANARPRSCARTSTIPPRTCRCGSTSASTPRSASVPRRTVPVPRGDRQASRRPDRSSRRLRCYAPLTGEEATGDRRHRGTRGDGRRTTTREAVRARSGPRRTRRDRRPRPRASPSSTRADRHRTPLRLDGRLLAPRVRARHGSRSE